jgi:hypothetical protein
MDESKIISQTEIARIQCNIEFERQIKQIIEEKNIMKNQNKYLTEQ